MGSSCVFTKTRKYGNEKLVRSSLALPIQTADLLGYRSTLLAIECNPTCTYYAISRAQERKEGTTNSALYSIGLGPLLFGCCGVRVHWDLDCAFRCRGVWGCGWLAGFWFLGLPSGVSCFVVLHGAQPQGQPQPTDQPPHGPITSSVQRCSSSTKPQT